jgi:23S rRNA-/tRNA-specific pseudouridylate synthase
MSHSGQIEHRLKRYTFEHISKELDRLKVTETIEIVYEDESIIAVIGHATHQRTPKWYEECQMHRLRFLKNPL